MVNDLMDGEVTEHCWSDGGGVYLPGQLDQGLTEPYLPGEQDQGLAKPKAILHRKARKNERTKLKRNAERSRMQAELNTGAKMSVLKKFPAHRDRVAFKISFDATHAPVTLPGWVGQSLSSLPSKVYTVEELTHSFKLKLIPWKGRYVIQVLLLPWLLPAF